MNGRSVLLDTNAVIKFLAGVRPLNEVDIRAYREFHISFVTEIELRSFRGADDRHREQVAEFLPDCTIHGISEVVKDEAVRLRRVYRLKTPDAIIAGTAIVRRMPFMTADKGLRRLAEEIDLVFVHYPG